MSVSSNNKGTKAMLPNLGRLRLCPTGARGLPNPNPPSVESNNPIFNALFGIAEIRERIFPNVIDALFKGTNPEDVCSQARHWMSLHPSHAAAARSNPGAWMRLIAAVFDEELLMPTREDDDEDGNEGEVTGWPHELFPDAFPAPQPEAYPDYWQEFFFRLCARYKAYRTGARTVVSETDSGFVFYWMAAVLHNGLMLEHARDRADYLMTPELCMAAVRQNGLALEWVPGPLQTRALVEAALANNEEAMEAIRNNDTALELLLDRPELLRYHMSYLHRTTLLALRRTIVEGDGSAFQYLPEVSKHAYLQLALATFPWAIDHWPEDRPLPLTALRELAENGKRAFSLAPRAEELRSNRHYVLNVVRHLGSQLQHASEELRNDVEVARAAVTNDYRALAYVGARARADPEFMRWFTQHAQMSGAAARAKRAFLAREKQEIDAENARIYASGGNIDPDAYRRFRERYTRHLQQQAANDFVAEHYPEWYHKGEEEGSGPGSSHVLDGDAGDEDEDD